MPQYDIKISKAAEEANKRRPSIELSPTLEKPVYIVTKNMSGRHILELIDALEKQKIQYQLQQETSTLGFVLNQRFFVIVDNKYGEVTLGADFASLLMTIVGYPRMGKNKKNKYLEKPQDIIKLYKEFKASPDTIKMSKSLIKSNQVVTEQPPASQLTSKIEVRSIIKYKSQDSKDSIHSHNSLKEACKKQCQRIKLIIMEDKSDPEYASICQYLFANEKGKQILEKAENLDEVRKKTLFHTNKVKIYYLTNKKNSLDLINSIFIGEVIIFSSEKQCKLHDMIAEPKIYAIAYRKDHLFKILHRMGIDIDPLKSVLTSKLEQSSGFGDSKNGQFYLKNQSNIKQKDINNKGELSPLVANKSDAKQVSKIDNNISVISEVNEASDLNASIMSKGSSCSRKIKRLGKSKQKGSQVKQESKIHKQAPPRQSLESERKRTLKANDYYQSTSKSKKNLTFKENLIDPNRIRRIKSIPKVAPQVFNVQEQNQSTMTEDEYYAINSPKMVKSLSGSSFWNKSLLASGTFGKKGTIHGLFYRQFVPKFHNIAQIIKMNPSSIFSENEKNAYIQSFVYVKQYDRFVRRLKIRLRDLKQQLQEYNFIVLLRDEDYPEFQSYCRAKNQYYYEEEASLASTFKENLSCLSRAAAKMNIYVFIESQKLVKCEVITCGRIEIFKSQLLRDPSDFNLSKTLSDLKEKVGQNSKMMNKDYLCA